MNNLTILDHPLVTHNLSLMREQTASAPDFRRRLAQICYLMAYEATKDLPLTDLQVTTPMQPMSASVLAVELAIVSILRAGLGMQEPLSQVHPEAAIGHIGFYRDEKTLEPSQYYQKLPPGLKDRVTLLVDPMLATGGSLNAGLTMLKAQGAGRIKCLTLVSVQEGIDFVLRRHPDAEIYSAALDPELNDKGYILPGLGDAGDRMFGTR